MIVFSKFKNISKTSFLPDVVDVKEIFAKVKQFHKKHGKSSDDFSQINGEPITFKKETVDKIYPTICDEICKAAESKRTFYLFLHCDELPRATKIEPKRKYYFYLKDSSQGVKYEHEFNLETFFNTLSERVPECPGLKTFIVNCVSCGCNGLDADLEKLAIKKKVLCGMFRSCKYYKSPQFVMMIDEVKDMIETKLPLKKMKEKLISILPDKYKKDIEEYSTCYITESLEGLELEKEGHMKKVNEVGSVDGSIEKSTNFSDSLGGGNEGDFVRYALESIFDREDSLLYFRRYTGRIVDKMPLRKDGDEEDEPCYGSGIYVFQADYCDSFLISFKKDGKVVNIVIDGGYGKGMQNMWKVLKNLKTIHCWVLTHRDQDHCECLKMFLERKNSLQTQAEKNKFPKLKSLLFRKQFYWGGNNDRGHKADAHIKDVMLDSINNDVKLIDPDVNPKKDFSKLSIEILNLHKSYDRIHNASSPENDCSISLIVTSGNGKKCLFTGDAHTNIVLGLNDHGTNQSAQGEMFFTDLPHHGSDNSCTEDFFKKVKPEICVVTGPLRNIRNADNIDKMKHENFCRSYIDLCKYSSEHFVKKEYEDVFIEEDWGFFIPF